MVLCSGIETQLKYHLINAAATLACMNHFPGILNQLPASENTRVIVTRQVTGYVLSHQPTNFGNLKKSNLSDTQQMLYLDLQQNALIHLSECLLAENFRRWSLGAAAASIFENIDYLVNLQQVITCLKPKALISPCLLSFNLIR